MKIDFKITITILVASFVAIIPLSAQFDDLYYDPDTDELYTSVDEDDYYEDDYYDEGYADGYEDGYDDEYSYATRINRFRRSSYNFDYFSPTFMLTGWNSPYFYGDPFLMGGYGSIGYFNRSNRWNRWNSWNNWDRGYYGYGGWNDPFCYNNFGWNVRGFYSPFSRAGYYGGFNYGFGNGFNSWGNGFNRWGNAYGTNQVVLANGSPNRYYRTTDANQRYYGSRNTTGTVVSRKSNLNSPRVSGERSRVKTRISETSRGSENRIASRRIADVTTRRTTKVRNSGVVANGGRTTQGNSRVSQSRRSGNTISNRSNSARVNTSGSTQRTRINNSASSSRTRSTNIERTTNRTSSRPSMNTNRTTNTGSSVSRTSTGSSRPTSTRSSASSSRRKGG